MYILVQLYAGGIQTHDSDVKCFSRILTIKYLTARINLNLDLLT